jgi:hypothetical protein
VICHLPRVHSASFADTPPHKNQRTFVCVCVREREREREDAPTRPHATTTRHTHPDATRRLTLRLNWKRRPFDCSLFHPKYLTSNLLVSSSFISTSPLFPLGNLNIAPSPIDLAPLPRRSYLTYKARSYLASYGHWLLSRRFL